MNIKLEPNDLYALGWAVETLKESEHVPQPVTAQGLWDQQRYRQLVALFERVNQTVDG